jgi:hypothetical protein
MHIGVMIFVLYLAVSSVATIVAVLVTFRAVFHIAANIVSLYGSRVAEETAGLILPLVSKRGRDEIGHSHTPVVDRTLNGSIFIKVWKGAVLWTCTRLHVAYSNASRFSFTAFTADVWTKNYIIMEYFTSIGDY